METLYQLTVFVLPYGETLSLEFLWLPNYAKTFDKIKMHQDKPGGKKMDEKTGDAQREQFMQNTAWQAAEITHC